MDLKSPTSLRRFFTTRSATARTAPYLLWNVLGVENQLINYPGHESASVKLSQPIKGDAYHHGGKTYYISDPTYIGSVTGMCMPSYVREKPGIDYTYGK